MKHAQVHILQPGYAVWEQQQKAQRADGTISLITSSVNCIVDTGLPKDKSTIISSLKKYNLTPNDIQYIICTHGDADHTSNNNLFPTAKLIVGFDIYEVDIATFFHHNYKIDSNITVTEMTGHDDRSIGVLVNTSKGIVAIVGDLFEYENDWQQAQNWIAFSKRPKDQIKNRAKIWEMANFIVPGHGNMFKVDKTVDILKIETAALHKHLKTNTNVYGDIDTTP